jgi:hypothetical protein
LVLLHLWQSESALTGLDYISVPKALCYGEYKQMKNGSNNELCDFEVDFVRNVV